MRNNTTAKIRRFSPAILFLALGWIAASGAALPAADPLARPALLANGKTLVGQLVAADADGRLKFRLSGGDRAASETIPATQLVRWGQFVETTRGPQVLLDHGGLLVAALASIDGGQFVLKSDLFGDVTLPAGNVLAVLIHPPADPHRRDRLLGKLVAGENKRAAALDKVFLDNGDELLGTAGAWHDDVLAVETDAGRVDLAAARITAIQFRRQSAEPNPSPQRLLIVGWRDGSRLCASSLVADAKRAQLTLAGLTPAITVSADTGAITALQTLGGQAVYLSDLEAVGYKHIPFLQLAWPYQPDHNVSGDLLRAGGKLFLKGLGMHSASRLTYDLDRPASRFEAALAVDDSAGGQGSVVFRVFVDTGDGRWEPKYTSPIVRGGDPPLPITVDLAHAKRISLLVEFADRGDQLDYADWLDARLIR